MVANEGLRKWDLYYMGMTNGQKKKMGYEWTKESKTMDWEDEEVDDDVRAKFGGMGSCHHMAGP